MQTKLLAISQILAEVNCPVYHYNAPDNTKAPYVVWAEYDRIDLGSNNIHSEKAWQGTIRLFTHTEFDQLSDQIENILNEHFSWYLNAVDYEEDTELIHTQWVWTYA